MEKLRITYNDGKTVTRNITYDEKIKISQDGKNIEIVNKEASISVFSCSLEQVESISLDNTLKESAGEWIESFIKEYMYYSKYWGKELEAAWTIHDLIAHGDLYIPCEQEDYIGFHSPIKEGEKDGV